MTPERWQQVKEAFHAALEVEEKERHEFVVRRAGGDAELMAEVEELLKRHVPEEGDGETADSTETTGPRSVTKMPPTACGEGPGDQVGRYRLLQRIGEGGMGMVYMAEQEEPVRRRVALKIIKPGMDSAQVIARFEAERQALALMDHPHIARVLDAGTTAAGRPYFVMELVQGEPVTQYCDRHDLTLRERLELFVQVCRAVQHAHQKGIIHRDLKPSNVLVGTCDGKPLPKVIDFGVAKALHQRLTERTMFTQFGAVVGTPEYMSPEQAENDILGMDTRSDIYTLGSVLYELLTGTTPLDSKRLRAEGFQKMMQTIKAEEPPRPSTRLSHAGANLAKISARRGAGPRRLVRQLSGDLDWIVMKALEKERSRRYESADALARDIERYLNNEPVEATPPSAFYRLSKAMRRHPAAVRWSVAAALAVVCGLGYFAYTAAQALQNERATQHRKQIADAYDVAKKAVMDRDLEGADRKVTLLKSLQAMEGEDEIIRGAIFVEQERPDLALEPLLKAEKFSTQPMLVGALLSWAYLNHGQVNASEAQLAKLARSNPKLPEEFLLNGWVTIPVDPVQAEIDLTVAMRLYNTSLARLMRAHAGVDGALDRNDDERMLDDALRDLAMASDELGSSEAGTFLKARTSMLVYQSAAAIYGHLASDAARLSDTQARHYQGLRDRMVEGAKASYGGLESSSLATTPCVDYLVDAERFDDLLTYCESGKRPPYWTANRAPYWRIYALYRKGKFTQAAAQAEKYKKECGSNMLCDAAFALMETEAGRKAARESAEAWAKAQQFSGSESLEQPMLLAANEVRFLAGDAEGAKAVAGGIVKDVRNWHYRDGWYERLAKYQAGKLAENELLDDARRSQMSQCEAHFNIALRHLNDRDREGALEHFRVAAQTHETALIEWRWAGAFVDRMNANPDWPEWLLKSTTAGAAAP
jgi:serine/threonine protein kinase